MIVTTIKGFTNVLGEPKDWDRRANGEVFGLPVKIEPHGDTISATSAWKPTAEEMGALQKGAPIHLRVIGGQPPVSVYVEGMAENLAPDFSEADARRVLLLSKALHLCQSQFEAYASLHAAKQTQDGDEKAATNRKIALICADALESAGSSDTGYVDAFYDLAKMMDIGARAKSPDEVWRTEMRPRLAALLAPASVVDGLDRAGLVNGSLDRGNTGVVVDSDQGPAGTPGSTVKPDLAIGDADDLAASGAFNLHGNVVEIGAGHNGSVLDDVESDQAILANERAETGRLRAELEKAQRDAKNANADADMYARAWQRELGGTFVNKRRHIDAMVGTTKRIVKAYKDAVARGLIDDVFRQPPPPGRRVMTADDIGMGPKDVAARRAVSKITADLRSRKLLDYLFAEEPENVGAYGYIDSALDLPLQREIFATWESLAREAMQ